MKRKISNYGDSVRARLLALARSENVQLEYLLLRYALERFLSPVITTKGFADCEWNVELKKWIPQSPRV